MIFTVLIKALQLKLCNGLETLEPTGITSDVTQKIPWYSIEQNSAIKIGDDVPTFWVDIVFTMAKFWGLLFITQLIVYTIISGQMKFMLDLTSLIRSGCAVRNIIPKWKNMIRGIVGTFSHLHVFHLIMNSYGVIIAWYYYKPLIDDEDIYIYYSQVPLYLLSSTVGLLLSYETTLKKVPLTCGASGGVFGCNIGYVVMGLLKEGIPKDKQRGFLMTNALFVMCIELIPSPSVVDGHGGAITDAPAHLGGAITGVIWLCFIKKFNHYFGLQNTIKFCMYWTYIHCGWVFFCILFVIYDNVNCDQYIEALILDLLKMGGQPLPQIQQELHYDGVLKRSYSCPGDMETLFEQGNQKKAESVALEAFKHKPPPATQKFYDDLSDPY